ncbi:MAG: 3'(2'),5'-bisphosphate nucleotidase CysQ, partial [Actinomycetota bacterium]|nr:3'(2'),5'-bisphosphate nucleotidase CysQ [Actinomycetota bacterium]
MTDVEVAAAAARAAAAVLVRLREEGRLTGRDLGDAGDAAAQTAIAGVLAERRPGDALFSEEAVDDRRRLTADRVWIVDPLDGTREYGEAPRPDWAVHVALWAGGDLVAGAVALPALGEVLVTDPAPAVPAPSGA